MPQQMSRFRIATGPLRLLPDFIIIGAQKCGTSSLYRYLIQHPRVAACLKKEVHYFDWHFRRGTRWYRAHFPTAAYRRMYETWTGHQLLTGEASPYYLFHPHAPERVRALLPGVKLIALLRDPVDRTLSAYHHQVRRGRESLAFLEALDREQQRIDGERARLTDDHSYNSPAHRHFSYLARGIYADQLTAWMKAFPRERLLVIRSEDFFEDPASVYSQVLDFVGLPHWEPPQFRRFNAADYDAMDPSIRQRLTDYFAPHNQRLYELVGRDFGWSQ
jgi:hypothetical protein